MSANQITLTLHHEDGSWWAESPGYYAGADTLPELLALVTEGLPFHLDCCASPPASAPFAHDGRSQTWGAPGRFCLA